MFRINPILYGDIITFYANDIADFKFKRTRLFAFENSIWNMQEHATSLPPPPPPSSNTKKNVKLELYKSGERATMENTYQ